MTTYSLTSTPMCHTPGIVRYAIAAYQSGDRAAARRLLVDGYNLPRRIADGVLSGKIPFAIEGETVRIEVKP